jgi:threonine dehydratase
VEAPSLDELLDAQRVLAAAPLHRTPLWRSASLSDRIGAEAWLKLELFQKTGSFKPRGATLRIAALTPDERRRGVIAVSAGNHAQAVAWAAAAVDVPSTIVTWETAPEVKMAAARAYGAETIRSGATPLEAFAAMERLRAERDLVLVHPYDDRVVVIGQATVGLEIAEDLPEVGTVVVPVGGGGLVAGIAAALRAKGSGARVVGVEPVGAPTLTRALAAGEPVPLERADTIADGLSAPLAGDVTLGLVQRLVDEITLVEDDDLRLAMRFLAERVKVLCEPAGAAAVAALLTGRVPAVPGGGGPRGPVVALVTGGNVDPRLLAEVFAA